MLKTLRLKNVVFRVFYDHLLAISIAKSC